MLFGYPIKAIEDNWLHECLSEMIQLIHNCIDTGKSLPDWPDIVPEKYRKRLKRRTGLRDRLDDYYNVMVELSPDEQHETLKVFKDQNQVAPLLSCQCDCGTITDLPTTVHEPVKKLFEFAYSLLTDLEIRDRHYKIIYDKVVDHICPFCGCEYFDAPGAPREALDHYLSKSKYPFAAANLHNLVPMGNKCNSRYKLTQDILLRDDGTRRKSFDPYNYNHHQKVMISLDKSQPFAGKIGNTGEPLPKWKIDFTNAEEVTTEEVTTEEVTTWDDVFRIRERYKRDVLDEGFESYLREFGNYCRSFNYVPASTEKLIDALENYRFFQENNGFKDKAFIKTAVFRMLHIHCTNGNQRLIQLIKDVVNDVSV